MDHQHFEELLLNDEPIAREENTALQAHLRVCPTCAALAQANLALNHVVMAAPASGFASRFQVRLAARRKAQRRRHLFGGLILFIGALGLGIWLALPILSTALLSPTALLSTWATTLAMTFSLIQIVGEAGTVILRVAAGFISNEVWALSLGFFSLLGFLWMNSIQKTLRLPQAI